MSDPKRPNPIQDYLDFVGVNLGLLRFTGVIKASWYSILSPIWLPRLIRLFFPTFLTPKVENAPASVTVSLAQPPLPNPITYESSRNIVTPEDMAVKATSIVQDCEKLSHNVSDILRQHRRETNNRWGTYPMN